MESPEGSLIGRLPDDVWVSVFARIDPRQEIKIIACVSRRFSELVADPDLWEAWYLRDYAAHFARGPDESYRDAYMRVYFFYRGEISEAEPVVKPRPH